MDRKLIFDRLTLAIPGFKPDIRPACANFASKMMRAAGVEIPVTNIVPGLFPYGHKVTTPQVGDLIIFDRTYDALPPAGIGNEDDMTHVGIVMDVERKTFVHFSSTQDAPVFSHWTDAYYQDKINCFLNVIDKPDLQDNRKFLKVFYHDGILRLLHDGKQIYFAQGLKLPCKSIDALIEV